MGPPVLVGLGLAVVLPVVALIVGTGVLGAEIDDGTVVHILTKPLPRWQIVLPKLVVAAGVTAVTVAVPLYVAGVLADSARLGLALAAAAAVGALAYSALFLALSLVTRRPVLLGLVYVLIWEGLLGNFVSGTKVLSIQQYVIALADRMAPTGLLSTTVSVPVAVVHDRAGERRLHRRWRSTGSAPSASPAKPADPGTPPGPAALSRAGRWCDWAGRAGWGSMIDTGAPI